MSAWQPIATKERDDTRILLFVPSDYDDSWQVAVGYWIDAGDPTDGIDGTWCTEGIPTHWMPLPDPPGSDAAPPVSRVPLDEGSFW